MFDLTSLGEPDALLGRWAQRPQAWCRSQLRYAEALAHPFTLLRKYPCDAGVDVFKIECYTKSPQIEWLDLGAGTARIKAAAFPSTHGLDANLCQ